MIEFKTETELEYERDELSAGDLDSVVGGLNPQPLPPVGPSEHSRSRF